MDAAGDLTCCKQAGDHVAIGIQHFRVGVDGQTAHGVVDTGSDLDGIVGSGIQRVCKAGTAKLGVGLIGHALVPVVHGLGKGRLVHANGLGQFLVGSALRGIAFLDVALDDAGSIGHGLIDHQPAVAARLCDLSSGNHVTGAHFVNEALAVSVDQDRAIAAQALGDQGSGVSLHSGVDLDLVHIHGTGTDGRCHLNALALDAGSVGGHKALELRLVLHDHVQVGTETAGSQDHGFGVDGDGLTGSAGGLNAAGCAVGIGQDLVGGGVQQDLNTGLFAVLLQQGDHVRAHREGLALCVHRAMDALDRSAAKAGNAVQGDAVLIQPVDGIGTVLAESLHQSGIVDALAADHGIQLHQLHRVEVAGGVGLISSPLLGHGSSQSGDGLIVSVLFGSGLQGLLDTCGLAELVLILIHGLAGVHAAGSADRVAAHHGLALQNDNALALVGSGNGGSHAGTARAHDDHIGVHRGVLSGLGGVVHSGLVVVGVQAGRGQGGSGSLLDGVGGDGCACNAVHRNAAALGDGAGQLVDGRGAHALGLVLALGGAADDLAVGKGQGNGHIAAKAFGSAHAGGFSAAVHQQTGCHHHHHRHSEEDLLYLVLLHGFSNSLADLRANALSLLMRTYQQKKGAAHSESSPLCRTKRKNQALACAAATAQATVAPTMGLLPMPIRPIISTCAGTEEEPAN